MKMSLGVTNSDQLPNLKLYKRVTISVMIAREEMTTISALAIITEMLNRTRYNDS